METKLDRDDLLDIVGRTSEYVDLQPNDKVLDINCGDGTLLGWYRPNIVTVGIDENTELLKQALNTKKADFGIPEKFSIGIVKSMCGIFNVEPKFKIITAVNVPEVNQLLADCKLLLHDKGAIVIQSPYSLENKSAVKLQEDVLALKDLIIHGISFHKTMFRAYITFSEYKRFAFNDYDAKMRLYFNFNTTLLKEMRQAYKSPEPISKQVREQSRNEATGT